MTWELQYSPYSIQGPNIRKLHEVYISTYLQAHSQKQLKINIIMAKVARPMKNVLRTEHYAMNKFDYYFCLRKYKELLVLNKKQILIILSNFTSNMSLFNLWFSGFPISSVSARLLTISHSLSNPIFYPSNPYLFSCFCPCFSSCLQLLQHTIAP